MIVVVISITQLVDQFKSCILNGYAAISLSISNSHRVAKFFRFIQFPNKSFFNLQWLTLLLLFVSD